MELTQKGEPRRRRAFDRHIWSSQEISSLITLSDLYLKNWSLVTKHFPHLTQNQIKNKYYYLLQHPYERQITEKYHFIAFDSKQIQPFDLNKLNAEVNLI